MAKIDLADTSESGDGDPQADRPPVTDAGPPEDKGSPELADAVPNVVAVPAPVEMVEATSDEAAEGIDWVRTGWVRLRVRGADGTIRTCRLRAPLLRELKRHRLDLEAAEDEIEGRRQGVLRRAAEMAVEMTKARDLAEPERSDTLAQLVRDDRKNGREFTAYAEDARIAWLESVFSGPLGVDGIPEDWPGYVVHPEFCAQLLQHWRTVPLAPGR